MMSESKRDITRLRRNQLLDDYWSISKRRRGALVSTALRTRSTSMRDILVYGATGLALDSEELKQRVLSGDFSEDEVIDMHAVAELGRLALLQNILVDDQLYGAELLKLAIQSPRLKRKPEPHLMVYIQFLITSGQNQRAQAFLERFPDIDRDQYHYLRAELLNPFTTDSTADYQEWLRYFNLSFTENNLLPVVLSNGAEKPFDRLQCPDDVVEVAQSESSQLVSVVMTSYKPESGSILTAVNSILNQTWTNLELIIVDDCSGPEYRDLFESLKSLDSRIQVLHLPENSGTYVARNRGYAAALGDYITGQDDDDWSHPQRISEQVKYLDLNPDVVGCRVKAVRCDDNLGRVRVGYSPLSENASSLLIRREAYQTAGNYLEARKGADTEYYYRIERLTGKPIGTIDAPLSVIRILSDSLSRGDFSAGWKHTARRSFRSSYEFWHNTEPPAALQLMTNSQPRVKIPRRFLGPIERAGNSELDIVFAGSWERLGGPQKSMLEEIHASVAAGHRVGVINLEAARFMNTRFQASLHPEIQNLINSGYVDEVHLDDDVAIRLLILRYPPILQFFGADTTNLSIRKMIILANQAPSELNGQDIRYLVEDCHTTARKVFKVEPLWVPQGPQVRKFLALYLQSPVLAPFDMPGILDPEEWWHDRLWYRSMQPVVGRHSRDDAMKWPEDRYVLSRVYPHDGSRDVRIMGGAKTPRHILEEHTEPQGWIVYKRDELDVKEFLYSLDYYVFFQHSEAVEAFGRAILEAIASGTLTILPPHFEEVFGPAAVYCDPDQIEGILEHFHSDFERYRDQVNLARTIVDARFSYNAYQDLIQHVLEVGV